MKIMDNDPIPLLLLERTHHGPEFSVPAPLLRLLEDLEAPQSVKKRAVPDDVIGAVTGADKDVGPKQRVLAQAAHPGRM
jgi:hypothetical protein